MELEFDKQIDALLRQQAGGRTITISEFATPHLDADELSAFVENAVPVSTRPAMIAHLADCDACRKMLSFAAIAREESAPAAGIIAPAAETAIPWYKKLFLFPNLAYVMGGLVFIFAGFIGVSVYRNNSAQFEMSKASPASEPSRAADERYAANTNAAAAQQMANTSANAANAAVPAGSPDENIDSTETVSDSISQQKGPHSPAEPGLADTAAPTTVPPSPKKDSGILLGGVDKKADDLSAKGRSISEARQEPKEVAKAEQEDALKITPSTQSSRNTQLMQNAPFKSKGPYVQRNDSRNSNDMQSAQPRDRESDIARKAPEKKAATSPAGGSSANTARKQVSGKTFEFRSGAWYDITYQGQGTINVRRNSGDYKKLDRGLRGIAESVLGTVVTVWNGKAYRID